MRPLPAATASAARGVALVAGASGLDLRTFRANHVADRVARALAREGCDDEVELARRLRADPVARGRFRRSIAVPVTRMFRDPDQFALLASEVLPAAPSNGRRLAVWSAGCANGSELATVGLLLGRAGLLDRALLLGSDLLDENIVEARRTTFEGVSDDVRSRLRFERRDLVADPPPRCRFHLVLCRNVAIYLTAPARAVLERRLADAVVRGGYLMVGTSERLARPEDLGFYRAGRCLYRKAL